MMFMYDEISIYGGGYVNIPISVNEWHTLALVAKGNTMTFYADGQIAGTRPNYHTVSSIKINYDE